MCEISVAILTYNCSDVIINNLTSIFDQDFPNKDYEIIIIDDCSKDGTQSIIESFIENKQKIRFIKLVENHGNGHCKNLVLKIARGKVLFFLDDHLHLKDRKIFERMYQFLQKHSEFAGVCGNYISSDNHDYNICRDIRRFMIYKKNGKDLALEPKKFIPFSIVICALSTNKIKGLVFPEDFKQNAAEDVFFQLQAHEKGMSFAYLSNICPYHDHSLSLKNLIVKSQRELNGFSLVVEKNIGNKYFHSVFLPCFFSFPFLLWATIVLCFFIPQALIITICFVLLEFIVLFPIFKFSGSFLSRLKTFAYCFFVELTKLIYIVKILIKKPHKILSLVSLLLKWEYKKIIYAFENRF